jgi:hypothetical protein
MNQPIKLFIGTPAIDQKVNVGYTFTIFNTAKLLPNIQTNLFILSGNSCITDARNHVATFFYHSDCDYLLFLDSDVEIDVNSIGLMLSLEKDIIGIPVAKKNFVNNKINMGNVLSIDNINNIEVAEVSGISTSCLLLSRKVIQSFVNDSDTYESSNSDILANNSPTMKTIFNIFKTRVEDNKFISEDYEFCNICKASYGYKIHALLTTSSNHYGTVPFSYSKQTPVVKSIYDKPKDSNTTSAKVSKIINPII